MRQLLLTILVFSSAISFGQKFSVVQLLKMVEDTEDNFDTYVSARGYKLFNIGNDERFNTCIVSTYTFGQVTDGKAPFFISYGYCQNGNHYVEYQFRSNQDYVSFKNQLKTAGFVFDDSRFSDDGTKLVTYKKKNSIVFEILTFTTGKNSLGETVTGYKIDVFKTN